MQILQFREFIAERHGYPFASFHAGHVGLQTLAGPNCKRHCDRSRRRTNDNRANARIPMKSSKQKTALVIGAGHNGLVCAFYLARAGFAVTVLERRGVVGGAAVTEEFHPGFRNSVASYTVSLLAPQVIADMGLHERGLRILERPIANFLPLDDGRYLKVGGGLARTQAEFAKFSARDAERLPAYYAMLDGIGDLLRELSLQTPPDLGALAAHRPARPAPGAAVRPLVARAAARPARPVQRERAPISSAAGSKSAPVQAALGFDGVVGNLRQPGHARLGLCAAAPHLRRRQRQEGPLGPRDRRHGRHHAGDGPGLPRRRRRRSNSRPRSSACWSTPAACAVCAW